MFGSNSEYIGFSSILKTMTWMYGKYLRFIYTQLRQKKRLSKHSIWDWCLCELYTTLLTIIPVSPHLLGQAQYFAITNNKFFANFDRFNYHHIYWYQNYVYVLYHTCLKDESFRRKYYLSVVFCVTKCCFLHDCLDTT